MKYREVGTPESAWQLRVFGKFSLTNPAGCPIQLHNKKCEALIAFLAAHRPHGATREQAAKALWPEKSLERRQESLRQAIATIRKSLGPDFLFSDRTHCSLSRELCVECDYDQISLRKDLTFMPDQPGDWFAQVRTEIALDQESVEDSSVMGHYLEFLKWSARFDPKGFYAFFRTNRYLVRGLAFCDLAELLNQAGRPEGLCGWADYWRGSTEDDLDLSRNHLKRALSAALREPDWELASEVCVELGKVYARRGDAVRANRIANAADEVAERSKLASSAINAARLRGTLLVHYGQKGPGLIILRQSADRIEDPVRRMVVESTQALFEAMSGQFTSAAYSLERGESLAHETGHRQTLLLNSLTRALLSIHDGPRPDAFSLLDSTAKQSYDSGARQLGVYADEVSAKLHLLGRDRAAALVKLGSARQNRLEARMARTQLESSMVATIR